MSTLFKDSIVYSTYGETIAVGDMLYMSQGTGADAARTAGRLYKLEVANPDRNVFYGIAKESGAAADTNKKVVTGGRFDGLAGLTPGLPIYADPAVAGGVTQSRPSSNVQVIGVAIDADSFSVNAALAGSFGAGEGSGGVGGVDILFVQDFESAALGDFTQTGLVLSSVDPLKGAVSANLVHDASVNQSFKEVRAVDEKFRNRNITLKLNIKSAASAGNVTLTVVDETNAVTLVNSEQLPVSTDVGGTTGIVTFNIPTTCTSISYEVIALPEAGSPVTTIDDIIAELSTVSLLSTSVEAAVVTPWQGYVPTFQGFGTPTNIEFEWRQVGENVEIRGKFVSGTPTAVEARVGLPAGLTSAGTSLIPSIQLIGYAQRSVSTTQQYGVLIEPSVAHMTFSAQGTNSGVTKRDGSALVNSGESLSFFASVPCAGLTATKATEIPLAQSVLVQEADSMVRVDTANGYGSTGTRVRRFDSIRRQLGSDIQYNPNSVDGDSFTILATGVYDITYTDDTGSTEFFGITKNASSLSTSVILLSNEEVLNISTNSNNSFIATTSWSGVLEAGDIIRAMTSNGGSGSLASQAKFTITRQGSLKQLNPNPNSKITIPTSELRMEGASTRGSTATAIVRFDNIAKIRGDAFEVLSDATLGTRIVMKKKGKLSVGTSLYFGATGTATAITKNQSNVTTTPTIDELVIAGGSASAAVISSTAAPDINVEVGDVIRVWANNTPVASLQNVISFSFQEQDISVSVTNTLPQFSESDSSVRVDTANGYGSTGTRIRRFSNVRDNIGNDIEYVPSAVNGDSFVVKSAGDYNISYSDQFNASSALGITINASSLTTSIDTLNVSERVAISQSSGANVRANVSWQGHLPAGAIVRAHAEGAASGTAPANTHFTISKVGKPNVTGVDVTPFVNVPQPIVEEISANGGSITGNGFITNFSGFSSTNSGVLTQSASAITALKRCVVSVSVGGTVGGVGVRLDIYKSGVLYIAGSNAYNTGAISSAAGSIKLEAGETVTFAVTNSVTTTSGIYYKVTAEALSDQILTAPETFSTDTANLVYAPSSLYTLATLSNAPVGTFITFTYAANTNTRTQTTTAPTQSTSDMNVNGIRLFTRAFNATSTAAEPAAIAIQIGKGLKGKSLDLYKTVGKVNAGAMDSVLSSTTELGLNQRDYNENTGVLLIDAGCAYSGSNVARLFQFSDLTTQTNGYLVINASKSPALTGVPLLQPRIATLSHQLPGGNQGGTFTAGSFLTRVLNTIDDPTGIVTSLASNQFTLPAGEYYIEAKAPAYYVTGHKARLRNITDGTDTLMGRNASAESSSGAGTITDAEVIGRVVLSTPKTFELQHRCVTTRVNDGFGLPVNMGVTEIYATVKITKVK